MLLQNVVTDRHTRHLWQYYANSRLGLYMDVQAKAADSPVFVLSFAQAQKAAHIIKNTFNPATSRPFNRRCIYSEV